MFVGYKFTKVPVNIYNTEKARMVSIQFILGYLRRL
jgi:hypothetical protein